LNRKLKPHSIIHGNACFAYFNNIWGIPAKIIRPELGAVKADKLTLAKVASPHYSARAGGCGLRC
jgi:hypothetical protein